MFRSILIVMLLTRCALAADRTVMIRVNVPDGTPTVYLPGNLPELGPWDPKILAMDGTGTTRTATLHVPDGFDLEYKFTLGSWDREGLGPSGTVMPNFTLKVDGDKDVSHDVADFKKGTMQYIDDVRGSGVKGRLEYWKDVKSKHLDAPRHVEIWLPPGYDENAAARYPVIYMHDGQNLFDLRIANTGVDWGVDEAIVRNVDAGKIPPVIVVGVWCTDERLREYSPWDLGPKYAKFLIEELMPQVNAKFRTKTGPENTMVMGSSMGGLISFYLAREHSDVFGMAGCLSTHFVFGGSVGVDPDSALILKELTPDRKYPKNVRLYFDYGTRGIDASYEPTQNKVNAWLKSQGFVEGKDFIVKKCEGATHNEAAWRARLDEPLLFLLGNR